MSGTTRSTSSPSCAGAREGARGGGGRGAAGGAGVRRRGGRRRGRSGRRGRFGRRLGRGRLGGRLGCRRCGRRGGARRWGRGRRALRKRCGVRGRRGRGLALRRRGVHGALGERRQGHARRARRPRSRAIVIGASCQPRWRCLEMSTKPDHLHNAGRSAGETTRPRAEPTVPCRRTGASRSTGANRREQWGDEQRAAARKRG